ncbi:carboxymuconolactone decarboxylase family protein [Halobacterium sp. R2-5]|uniref:carboxymuconolactone decarboxylase family protein n=1 Tax=Halobacterium sp. R2-5 TaxID=2715751 RepID=UPI00142474DD|nr:carboxymuconolactone decarboxylase family protein [Halobacterium sp. R2-5]NIC00869.1 carboxymuconolactone decarboxylase family protein [Halobacterium sp. R2-5]
MSGRPDIVRPGEADDEAVNDLLEEAQSDWYGDAAFFGAMAHVPPVFKRIVDTFEAFGQGEHVDPALFELMRLKVAECHQCAYCATVRTLEVRDEVADKETHVFGTIDEDGLTRREYLAVRLAEQLSENPHRITEEDFEELRDVYTDSEIIELLLFGSLEVGLDRFCIALELQTTGDGPYPDDIDYPLEEARPERE